MLAAAGGLLLYAGHPPVDIGLAGLVALVPLLVLAREVSVRAGFGWGLLSGLCFFVPLLSWIGRFGLLPWGLLALIQALAPAAFVAGMAAWGQRPGRIVAAAVWWVALEGVRGAVPLGGFPWGLLGYTQHDDEVFLQVARTLGVAGIGLLLAAYAAALEEALARWSWRPLMAAAAILGLALSARLVPLPPATGRSLDIAAVQGLDVELGPVVDREDITRARRIAQLQLETTRRLVGAGPAPALTVWPENSLDADFRVEPQVGALVDETLALLDGGALLASALLDGPREDTLRNAVVQVATGGEVVATHLKRRLVPFGEYVPLRALLGDFPPLRAIARDQVPGTTATVFTIDGAKVAPVTCFESIYPALVHDQVEAGAELLVVSTNNSSFGRTAASDQHLAASELRAVETGRWVLQAGISGVSGVVDPLGRVAQRTDLYEQTVVRARLPLVRGATPALTVAEPLRLGVTAVGLLGCAWLTGVALAAGRRARKDHGA